MLRRINLFDFDSHTFLAQEKKIFFTIPIDWLLYFSYECVESFCFSHLDGNFPLFT